MGILRPKLTNGKLEDYPLPVLFASIHGGRKTGVLILQTGNLKKAIFFKYGLPIAVRSNIVAETLAKHLEQQGEITEDAAEKCLQQVRETGRLEIDILAEMDVVSRDKLANYQNRLFWHKVLGAFGWEQGDYTYKDQAEAVPEKYDEDNVGIIAILDHGLRQGYDLERLQKESGINGSEVLRRGPLLINAFGSDQLEDDEEEFLSLLDGRTPVKEIIESTSLIKLRAYQFLYLAQLVEFMDYKKLGKEKYSRDLTGERPRLKIGEKPELAEKPRKRPKKKLGGVKTEIPLTRDAFQREWDRIRSLNYYEIMAVPKDADTRTIKKAYFGMSKFYHPDRFFNPPLDELADLAKEVFTLINKAYDTLTDPEKLKEYQNFLETGKTREDIVAQAQDAFQAELKFVQGQGLMKKKNYTRAIDAFSWAIKLKGDEPAYLLEMAMAKILEGQRTSNSSYFSDADELLKKVIGLDKQNDTAYMYKAFMVKDKDPEKAQKYYRQAVKYNPENIEAQREIRLHAMRKEKGKSR
jgi:curved DNA-binding protein CbpA